ncbi:hypothetical protein E3P94_01241 [Wallemia ichthyophaga]|nr:hypothetical protein E3P95_01109 [Wallemia ichthyophaga]TIB02870.1 hypothetical protein E3P94_01241 [Wallemia ichthyophaga]
MLLEGPIRIALNMLRLLTIGVLVLVAVTQLIETIMQSKHVDTWVSGIDGTNGYSDGTDIPTHFMGPVWSLLTHLCLFTQCWILALSEVYNSAFSTHIPLIGSEYGLLFAALWEVSVVFTGLSQRQTRKSALVGLYALAIVACINLLLGLFGTKVKEARSMCSIDAWCSVLPPPFSWIAQLTAKCSKSRKVSREMRDQTSWSFVGPRGGEDGTNAKSSSNSTQGGGTFSKSKIFLSGLEKIYDRYKSRKEPLGSRSETPLPRYSDDKHSFSPPKRQEGDESIDNESFTSKRSVRKANECDTIERN